MNCRLVLLSPEWESKVREFTLHESQKDFVFLPSKALDFFRNEDCVPVVVLFEEDPVGFFVLHNSEEVYEFADSDKAIFLRAFSIDRKNQGKGYASLAMNGLPLFVLDLFPHIDEIILTVNTDNLPAKRLYEKSGFVYKGKTKLGRSGVEFILHYSTRNAKRLN